MRKAVVGVTDVPVNWRRAAHRRPMSASELAVSRDRQRRRPGAQPTTPEFFKDIRGSRHYRTGHRSWLQPKDR